MSKKPRNGYMRKDNTPNEIRRERNNNKLRGCPTPAKRSFRSRTQAIDHAAVTWRYNRPDAPDFIKKHPVPWKLARTIFEGGEADGITDAQGALIARTADASGYQSWLEGDMDEFIDFVNKHFADHAEEVGRADS